MSKTKFLDLGTQPIANGFLKESDLDKDEYTFNLSVGICSDTFLVSLMDFVDPPKMFNESYPFHTSASPVMESHFKRTSNLLSKLNPRKVMEIGSNDGAFLKNFHPSKAISVEPCSNFARHTQELGYTTYDEFWTQELADRVCSSNGKQDLIFSANCMCHIPDIEGAFKAVASCLDKDGVFVFEDPSLVFMLMRNSYDQIYDEHAHIFSLHSLSILLKRAGLKIWKVDVLENVHGGSCRIYAVHENNPVKKVDSTLMQFERICGINKSGFEIYYSFARNVQKSKEALVDALSALKDKGKKVISFGATSKSTTVFNYCGIGNELIDYITDRTDDKIGKFSPGKHIPIIAEGVGFDDSVDAVFLGAWNYKDAILTKYSDFKGSWITHVPEVSVI